MQTAEAAVPAAPSKALNIGLWAAQVLLLSFLFGGWMKAATPVDQLAAQAAWMADIPEALLRFIGVMEIFGALGVMLPALARIKPWLTPVAATGLATVMVLAAAFHIARGELTLVPPNVILGGLAAFVAWGRFGKAPIPPR